MEAYLDHAASTPTRPEAIEAMLPFLRDQWGNPTGVHARARAARKAVDESREVVAALLGCSPGEVVFTSGGTEADDLAISGVLDARGGTPVCTAVEHHAVLDPVQWRGGEAVAVDGSATVDLVALAAVLDERQRAGFPASVVSVMLANNEVGTIQPLADVAAVVRRHAPDAALHTDAVQAAAWCNLGVTAGEADLVSISAHKFGGPKGVGALAVRGDVALSPRLLGGGQERGRRSGTHNVAGIVGMAAAARLILGERDEQVPRVAALRDRLEAGLVDGVDGVVATLASADPAPLRLPSICHVCIEGIDSESLLFLADRDGVAASAASSCASGATEASHVLAAMGVPARLASGALRLSLGWNTDDAAVDHALAVLPGAIERLRRLEAPPVPSPPPTSEVAT